MLPLRDINPTRSTPYMTYALIAANVLVFIYQSAVLAPAENQLLIEKHAATPYFLFSGYAPALSTPFTSMFLHGGFMHLAGNMWMLHIFGDNVEDVLGPVRYFIFYVVCGLVAVLAHGLTDPSSTTPLIGASGAIAGVLGAYLLLYPRARVLTFAFIFVLEIPAVVFILIYLITEVFNGLGSLARMGGDNIAHFAHIGGLFAGMLYILGSGRTRPPPRAYLGPRINPPRLR